VNAPPKSQLPRQRANAEFVPDLRIELVAALLASACDHAYVSGEEDAKGDGPKLFALTEELVLRRGRNLRTGPRMTLASVQSGTMVSPDAGARQFVELWKQASEHHLRAQPLVSAGPAL
jgi:hypothetical protein